MAITYADVFALIGEWVERTNEFRALYATIDGYQTEVMGDYSSQSQWTLAASIPDRFKSFKDGVRGWINICNAEAFKVLTDNTLVAGQLPIGGSSDLNQIMPALWKAMIDDSATIKRSTVSLGSVTNTTSGAYSGELLVSKVLDGYNAPGTGLPKNRLYAGVDSEVSCDDSVTVKCVQDSESGGVTEGGEQWIAYGSPKVGWFDYGTEGSGMNRGLTTLNAGTSQWIVNPDFESNSGNTPTSWTVDSGTVGTHIFTGTSTDAYRGSYALKITGDGSQATIGISQSVTGSIDPRRRYLLAAWVKGHASTASGTLTIKFAGTGYTAASTEKISMDATALSAQTSYGLEYFWINFPAEIPNDLELVVEVTGTLTNAKSVCIDGIAFGPATYENGVAMAIVAGSTKFLVGDQSTFTVTNNDAGVFQSWFRAATGYQLPSDASPSIADSYAT